MNRRLRVHLSRTQRFSKYLKPGALAKLRDSTIIAIAKSHVLTRRVNSVAHPSPSQTDSSLAQIEFLPEFPIFARGPQCFGRKKLIAAKAPFTPVPNPNDSFINLVNNFRLKQIQDLAAIVPVVVAKGCYHMMRLHDTQNRAYILLMVGSMTSGNSERETLQSSRHLEASHQGLHGRDKIEIDVVLKEDTYLLGKVLYLTGKCKRSHINNSSSPFKD
ncbi:hypothetical protein Cgig2_019555 [Carnegiea gigantea]|uniref:Uncharacterized protein n=1 Tax=Carnegiea gigantea TaxID=171969 RepID=A0A9Q1KHS4_9CARY|nr:hypothetical protein Cgig2_019555 [Carnegiea gigantea]